MRFDHKILTEMVAEDSRILDLGCGSGELLAYLYAEKKAAGSGIEIDESKVITAIGNGLQVLQGDINEETYDYADKTFDYVILSRTLQQVLQPEKVIQEMLRIGKKAIVSFPCFNHLSIKLQLLLTSKAPVTEELPFEWYDTPNIRVITLKDFRIFCAKFKIRILQEVFISSRDKAARLRSSRFLPNWFARYGIFLITDR